MAKEKIKPSQKLTESDKEELEGMYKKNIAVLQDNIQDLLDTIDEPMGDTFTEVTENVQSIGNIQAFDYERESEVLKIEAKETLECLANLYLDRKTMRKKNISSIIKNDANYLSTLNWQIASTKRSIIQAMQQLDIGVPDPEMYKAIAPMQKELRDNVKSAQEMQRKMKEFYKEMRDELTKETITTESDKTLEDEISNQEDDLFIVSQSELDEIANKMKKDKDFMNKVNH